MKLVITSDTPLKALPTQASEIEKRNFPEGTIPLAAGQEFELLGYEPFEGAPVSESDDHIYVQLKEPVSGFNERRGFVYGMHCKVEGTEPDNDPTDRPAIRAATPKISVPGIRNPVPINQAIYRGSNFTWAEFTKGGSRVPVSSTVTHRIVKIAHYLDDIRNFLGDRPITITSGYRDPISNRSVGGARDSRHMYGDAVDFCIDGLNLVDAFYKLKRYHKLGGLAVGNGFIHVDLRPGAAARWTYRGGPQVSLW